jgi:hypothetical protein
VPPTLPPARCALTAPFHPCRDARGPCGPRPGGLLSVALSLGFPPPDVIRRRIRMEPGLSSASKRRPSGRLAGEGIWERRDGGQAESDAMVEHAGLSDAPAREPRPRSFIVASRELWDCAGSGPPASPDRFGRLCGRRRAVLRPSGAGRDGRFRSHDKDSGSFLGAGRRYVRLGLPDAAAAECAFRRHARRWHGRSHRFGGLRRELLGAAATPQPSYYGGPPPGYGGPPPRCAQWAYDYNGNRVCTAFY